jgi:hypothetical protein
MLLERSRGIIAGLVLNTQPDYLSMLDAEAASRFRQARQRLTTLITSRESGLGYPSLTGNQSRATYILHAKAEKEAEEELLAIIRRIQDDPKTHMFLRPPSEHEVMESLGADTIVLVSADHSRCDAFCLNQAYGTRVVRLPELTFLQAEVCIDRLGSSRPYIDPTLLVWLWDSIGQPVLDALGFWQPPTDGIFPRIIWIMAGNLQSLPIHAAGRHAEGSRATVIGRVMSSYSSSLRSFVLSRKERFKPPEAGSHYKALLVSMGQLKYRPELPDLPLAQQEVNKLHSLGLKLGLELVRLECATREALLTHLDTSVFFHFAGHGQSNPLDPSCSGLLLEDGLLTVAELQGHSRSVRRRAFLSYLSACLTGANDAEGLEDEGIHLAAAFQLGGSRHVIATLWQVFDATCPLVAEAIYRNLAAAPLADRAVCAALHLAIKHERDVWARDLPQAYREEPRPESRGDGTVRSLQLLMSILDNLPQRATDRDGKLKSCSTLSSKLVKAEWVPYVHYGP